VAQLVGLQEATVLVVEGDPLVLEVVARLVREGGYDTIPARDGREAWSILQQGTRPIDLVLADVVLPHMSDTELAAHVVARQPGLPVVLMSAYS
jgi:two-component system, cell cycle sensor histidine kinase and response regulator CckA